MRKTLTAIATIALLLIFTSSYNSYNVDINIGSFAPNFEIAKEGKSTKLSELRGNYVVVNFWTSDNAESRIRNIQYDRLFKALDRNSNFIAINFDEIEGLQKELIKVDKLSDKSQFHDGSGTDSEVYKSYHLESGMNSFLLDKDGKIIAINPTKQQLTKYFCQ